MYFRNGPLPGVTRGQRLSHETHVRFGGNTSCAADIWATGICTDVSRHSRIQSFTPTILHVTHPSENNISMATGFRGKSSIT